MLSNCLIFRKLMFDVKDLASEKRATTGAASQMDLGRAINKILNKKQMNEMA